MNHILESLGLTKDIVKSLSKDSRSKQLCESVFDTQVDDKNYLYAIDQRRIRRRLNGSDRFIETRFFEGYKPKTIAKMLGVSEESVRSRLRKKGAFGKSKKPGRPKSRDNQSAREFGSIFLEHAVSHSILEEITLSAQPQLQ